MRSMEFSGRTVDEAIFHGLTEMGVTIDEVEIETLRQRREAECFSVINRGALWFTRLIEEQKAELDTWYQESLDVTETRTVPDKPSWL